MAELERCDVSCGSQTLCDLSDVDSAWLRVHLQRAYMGWRERNRNWEDGDNKYIFKGETIIFSDRDSNGHGKRLERLIKANDLGKVVKLPCINPNTGRAITTYLWNYNGNKVKGAPKKPIVRRKVNFFQ